MTTDYVDQPNDDGKQNSLFIDSSANDAPQAPPTGIMPRDTIAEIVRCRNEALALYAKAYEATTVADTAIKSAIAMMLRASGGARQGRFTYHLKDYGSQFHGALNVPDRAVYLDQAKRIVDTYTWQYIVEFTGIETLMDKQAREELHRQMTSTRKRGERGGREVMTDEDAAEGMPEITEGNIIATLERFRSDANMIFQRGLVNVFAKLDRRFRSHDGFKVGSRIILDYMFDSNGHLNYGRDQEAAIIDIERVFTVLDGENPAKPKYMSIVEQIRRDRHGYRPQQSEHDGAYFKVRAFKNGNAHLWFTRDDLVEKVNKLLADYYGETIGDGKNEGRNKSEADPFANPKTTLAKSFGFYPSPEPVVKQLLDHDRYGYTKVYLNRDIGKPQLRILEPSAGTGNIARRCISKRASLQTADYSWRKEHVERFNAEHRFDNAVDVVEVQRDLAAKLSLEGIYRKVYAQDFLALTPEATGLYDYVLMNPPFDLERDIDHVMHAWKFLAPGGSIHAVMSAGTEFRETRKAIAFRAHVEKHKGTFEDLPLGSFAEVGTYVNTCIVRITKPAA